MIPNHLRPFFWDVNLETFQPETYPEYTIARVLEVGDVEAVAWMKHLFNEETIKEVVRRNRSLSPRSANYWALLYQIPAHDVAALR